MQKQAKGVNAPSYRASAAAELGGGKTYDAAPVSFEGDHTLIAEVNSADAAFPLMIVTAPARTAGQISLVNQTPWSVTFTITRLAGQLGAPAEIEVAPGEAHQVRPG
jgi:hypothetical protein